MASVWNRPVVAAAGGIAAAYAQAGADIIMTPAPYLARPYDVQLQIEPVGGGRSIPMAASV